MLKFKDLSDTHKRMLSEVYRDKTISWDERVNTIITKLGVSERTVRRWWVKLGLKERVEPQGEQILMAENKEFDKTKKYFLISCAQNATPVNKGFLHNMEKYAEFLDGQLLIIPIRYKNPTSIFAEKEDDWWDDKIIPYLSLKRHKLNKNITVLSDVKTQPTDSMPLNGFEALSNQETLVLAHPRVHMKSLPTLDDTPKMMFTTGSCTKDNYINSKRGKIGEFHHTYGFVIVEIKDNETYYIRQVTATADGSFNDLYYNVTNGEVKRNNTCAALVKGDIHYGSHDQKVLDVSFNELVPKLKPDNIVLHDIFDGKSINHHDEHDFVLQYLKEQKNENSLQTEIDEMLQWIDVVKKDNNIVVVFSNHDDWLNKYIINKDFKKDIKNAKEYLKYAQILLEDKAPKGLIGYIINEKFPDIKCLGRDDNFKVLGWELAIHGMDGVGGSRGSISQFKKLNTHIITGHAHNPCRMDGAVQVGTNTKLRLGYNHGMSNWVHSDAIIHNDKKVQQIFYIGKNKEFTMLK
jgi:hypothetical protein